MSTDISGATTISMNVKNKKALDLSTIVDELALPVSVNWTYGTGANQVNVLFHDKRPLADGANETLDLFVSGTLLDSFGDALTMTALKFLFIRNNSADASLKVLGTAVTALGICADPSDIIIIKPGGWLVWCDPSAAGLVVSTNKNLKLEHDGTGSSSLTYDVVLLGLD